MVKTSYITCKIHKNNVQYIRNQEKEDKDVFNNRTRKSRRKVCKNKA